MFGHPYFGAAYYGPAYFGPAVAAPAPLGGGNAPPLWWRQARAGQVDAGAYRPPRRLRGRVRLRLLVRGSLRIADDAGAAVDDTLLALLLEEDTYAI